jgi:hypothetical protein
MSWWWCTWPRSPGAGDASGELSEGVAMVSMRMSRTGPAKRKPMVLGETRSTTVTGLEMFQKLLPSPL